MKIEQMEFWEIVESATAEGLTQKINRTLMQLKGKRPVVEFPEHDTHTARIRYTETTYIPETLADEYLLKGEDGTCSGCPHFQLINDMRRKWHNCDYFGDKTTADTPACDIYYREMKKGGATE